MKRNGILTGLIAVYAAFYTTHLGFAIDLTAGRARSLVGTVVSLISLVIGGVALARAAGRTGTANGRTWPSSPWY